MANISVTTNFGINMSDSENKISQLVSKIETMQNAIKHSSTNADAFFLIINGVIIYCKYVWDHCVK